MNIKRFATAIATGSVLIQALAPITFADTLTISGNGAGSANAVTSTETNNTNVSQNNTANVTNAVNVHSNTGDNGASFNTGGNVTVTSGSTDTTVGVHNALNTNHATVTGCGACATGGNSDVTISGNGAGSQNQAALGQTNNTSLNQNNAANVVNAVHVKSDTGDNDATANTGGNVHVMSGPAKVNVQVSTAANANSASIGGGVGSVVGSGNTSLLITGNGAGSANLISAAQTNNTTLNQANSASVVNPITVKADTGDNDASFNTGGDVWVQSGLVDATVGVYNAVNFNAAAVDCDCVLGGLTAKIAGNGAGVVSYGNNFLPYATNNTITAARVNNQNVGQGNGANIVNPVDLGGLNTGDNSAFSNTAFDAASDPMIIGGPAKANVLVSNSGNVNTFGNATIPNFSFDFNVNSMMQLWSVLWS